MIYLQGALAAVEEAVVGMMAVESAIALELGIAVQQAGQDARWLLHSPQTHKGPLAVVLQRALPEGSSRQVVLPHALVSAFSLPAPPQPPCWHVAGGAATITAAAVLDAVLQTCLKVFLTVALARSHGGHAGAEQQ